VQENRAQLYRALIICLLVLCKARQGLSRSPGTAAASEME
jgi:hypothetical protein